MIDKLSNIRVGSCGATYGALSCRQGRGVSHQISYVARPAVHENVNVQAPDCFK